MVSVPSIETVIGLKPKPQQCKIMHQMECSCWVGPLYNKTQKLRERLKKIQEAVVRVEQEVANLEEFKNLKEFAVVHQPFTMDTTVSGSCRNGVLIIDLLTWPSFRWRMFGIKRIFRCWLMTVSI